MVANLSCRLLPCASVNKIPRGRKYYSAYSSMNGRDYYQMTEMSWFLLHRMSGILLARKQPTAQLTPARLKKAKSQSRPVVGLTRLWRTILREMVNATICY